MTNIQILDCHGIFGHLSVIFRSRKATISWAVKYLNIFRTRKQCIQKICITLRSLSFCSPICDAMNVALHRENRRLLARFPQRFDEYLSYQKSEIGR